jgi:hypothetical protein
MYSEENPSQCHFVDHESYTDLILSNSGIRGKKPANICHSLQNLTPDGKNNDPGGRKSWDKGVVSVKENHGDPLSKRYHPGFQTRCYPYTELLN